MAIEHYVVIVHVKYTNETYFESNGLEEIG